MINTSTFTSISILIQCMVYQLKAVNEMTVQSDTLRRIIEYCVPERILSVIYIYGVRDNEAHTCFRVDIDYSDGEPEFSVKPLGPPRGNDGFDRQELSEEELREKANCPVWQEAIPWYMQIIRDAGLTPEWAVVFSDRRQEMRDRFGLSPSEIEDKTTGQKAHPLPNSRIQTLHGQIQCSEELEKRTQ